MEIETDPILNFRDPVALFEHPAGVVQGYDVSPDGRRFVFIGQRARTEIEDQPREIHVVLNWFEELKQLVPVP